MTEGNGMENVSRLRAGTRYILVDHNDLRAEAFHDYGVGSYESRQAGAHDPYFHSFHLLWSCPCPSDQ